MEPKERIRKPEAGTGCGTAWGWGTDPHLTYSSTDYILIMGQGCLVKFIKIPSGPVIKNLLCSAGHSSSISGPENKIPHAMAQLSLQATREGPAGGK